jgi:Nucleoside 2-deoxyribosyltransferase
MRDRAKPPKGVGVPTHLHTIFLCGPISGLTILRASAWRSHVLERLGSQMNVIDPMRDSPDATVRSQMASTRILTTDRLRHGKQTVTRNRFDIERCDLVLACFLGAKSISIGAVGEIFWADAMHKPVIIVREEDNPHNHDMLNEIAGWIFDDLDAALEQVKRVLEHN